MTSCITDFLCTLLMFIPIRLHSPLLFRKYCDSHSSRMQMYRGGRECNPSSQKLKGKDFIHTSWMWATVMWGQSPYSPQISDPIPTPPFPTSQPPVPEYNWYSSLGYTQTMGKLKEKKRKKKSDYLLNINGYWIFRLLTPPLTHTHVHVHWLKSSTFYSLFRATCTLCLRG